MLKAPRGTSDILPPESWKWAQLEKILRETSYQHNFDEIRTPMFEHVELFSRTVGEATDIVQKEMYVFPDKTGRFLALRPEGTAPVARAFVEHGMAAGPLPRKFFYIGSMFRYEKPQAGRYREFRQYGAEILGSPSPYSDVEVIVLAMTVASRLGLTGTRLVLNSIGCPVCRNSYRAELVRFLSSREQYLCSDCRARLTRNPLRVLDCKEESCRTAVSGAPSMLEYLCGECRDHWDRMTSLLSEMAIEYTVDASLVRGLDYYTRTVFELKWSPLGAQDTLLGGGRYDGLVQEIGGPPTAGVGFAMGLERIMMAWEKGANPPRERAGIDCFVVAGPSQGSQAAQAAFLLLRKLRENGLSCDFDPLGRSMKAQMKQADRVRASYVVIIGEDELKSGQVSVKSMSQGWQKRVPLDDAVGFLCREVEQHER